MVARIADVRIAITATETEALLLEQSLIEGTAAVQHRPEGRQILSVHPPDAARRLPHAVYRGSKRPGKFFGPSRPTPFGARSTRWRRCSSSAIARTATSRIARGPACSTRSGAAVRPASASSTRTSTRKTCATCAVPRGAVRGGHPRARARHAVRRRGARDRRAAKRNRIRQLRRVQQQQDVVGEEGTPTCSSPSSSPAACACR